MFRHLRIHRGLCLALMVPLVAGPAFGAEGVVYDLTGPGCPNCRAPGSPPCPANVKYFGYYPTRWRPWPGTEPAPTPAEQTPPNRVEVPPADQEAVGKPGAATTDTGTATPPATGSPTDPNSSNTPTNPSALPPVTVPLLNGLPVPNGAQLPNGAPVPAVTLPNGGAGPDSLPAPNQPDPAAKKSPLPTPGKAPATTPARAIPGEPGKLNQVWPDPAQPTTAPSAIAAPTSVAASLATVATTAPAAANNGLRIVPGSAPAPSYQWPPANMLRSSTIKAGFQAPVESSAPAPSNSRDSAAWIEPLPPLGPSRAPARSTVPSNSLRIDMPPISAPASVASMPDRSSPATVVNAMRKPQGASHSDENVSMLIIAQKPAHPAAIPADDWAARPENGPVESKSPAAANALPSSKTLDWSAANSPATLAPIYKCRVSERSTGNASVNSPGAISSLPPTATKAGLAGEIRFSPLRDAVANGRLSAADAPSESMSAIDPLQIGRSIAEDQQPAQRPAMNPVPIQNGLPTGGFQVSDYVSQDRAARPTSYASTHQPELGAQRTFDRSVQPASFEQACPVTAQASNLTTIDPLEVARSFGATPAPTVPVATRPVSSTSIYGAAGNGIPPASR